MRPLLSDPPLLTPASLAPLRALLALELPLAFELELRLDGRRELRVCRLLNVGEATPMESTVKRLDETSLVVVASTRAKNCLTLCLASWLLLAGCATPSTARVVLDRDAVRDEVRRQQEMAATNERTETDWHWMRLRIAS